MTELQVYWWLMLDNMKNFLIVSSVGVGCWAIVKFYLSADFKDMKKCILPIMLFIIITLPAILIPNSKQYAMIKVFPKIASSEVAQEIPSDMTDMYKMAKDYMKSMLTEEAE